ncbi:hypothetical protein PS903_00554 [Pseudomonas fluorescens]|nr:hypothetical protein PS903_00554 [Pseudomonas fluorescens]
MLNKEISYVKDHYFEIETKDFHPALANFSSPDDLIIALLNALGFDEVLKEIVQNLTRYYSIVQNTRIDLVAYDNITKQMSGNASSDLEKAFLVTKAIEGELSDALYYPADLRKKTVDLFIANSGVSVDLYKKILSGWKQFR